MAEYFTIQSLVILVTLTVLEIVLGVDNIIFLAIVTQDVPEEKRDFVRKLGLTLALVGRIVMVLGISWLLGLDETLITLFGHAFSTQDIILLGGGLFLTYKAVTEIYKATAQEVTS
jgi:predicted tellurium resistance membrane protein TerC